jgi:hypothetical protein
MDDGRKIKEELLKIKNTFLRKKFDDYDTDYQKYNLEEEFKATKKNKDVLFKLSFIGFVIFIITVTFLVTTWINERSRKINVSIDDFKDVMLKDLLTSSKRYENQLVLVRDELDDINNQQNNEVAIIKDKAAKQTELVNQRRMKEEDRVKLLKEIKKNEQDKILEIYKKYAKIIKEKEIEIENLKDQINKFDKNKVNQAVNNQDIISSEDTIKDLQIERIVKFYENKEKRIKEQYEQKIKNLKDYYNELVTLTILKYNPSFEDDEEISKILSTPYDPKNDGRSYKISDQTIYNEYINDLKSKGISNEEKLKDILKKAAERNKIMKCLNDIPYKNAVPELLGRLNTYDNYIMNEYRNMFYILLGLSKKNDAPLSKQDELIKNYIFAVESIIDRSIIPEDKRYAGYVLNPSDKENLIIKFDAGFNPKNNQNAYILSRENKVLSGILFSIDKNTTKAKVVELRAKIEPFDLVVIDR